jgi:hypothetical protein
VGHVESDAGRYKAEERKVVKSPLDCQKKGENEMGLPRAFVGFSSTDIHCYHLMRAWKSNENIDFNFTDCQLSGELNSENEAYIKRKCRERINMAGKYVLLIGKDTKSKYKYVRWEAEVAIEKGCTIIGVNLNGSKCMQSAICPPIVRDIGAIFVSFSPKIVAYAIKNYSMHKDNKNYNYKKSVYEDLGL